MIKRILRIYHWRARARFWRQRAQRLQAQLADTVMLLEGERDRNRVREDTFVSASVMGQRGMYGVPPRMGAAIQPPTKAIAPVVEQYTAWDSHLSWADKQEFELEWKTSAERAGVSVHRAQQDFLVELAKRRTSLNDDPFSN